MKNNETCIHDAVAPITLLENLHYSQAGSGRHKCPVCAYEQGFILGSSGRWKSYKEYCNSLIDGETCQEGSIVSASILKNLGDNQGGTGRHKCTNCAFKEGFESGILEIKFDKNTKLILVDTPKISFRKIKHNKKPIKNIDFAKKEIENKKLGLIGELFVIELEKRFLIENGRLDLAELIVHSSKEIGDGLGYDIISYDLNGNKKYIEVKTTRGDKNRPFYLTKNEIEFSLRNKENYYLYRIFDFNLFTGKYYYINGSLKEVLDLEPIQYIAIPKK